VVQFRGSGMLGVAACKEADDLIDAHGVKHGQHVAV
jgi:hypothetical protein